MKDIRSYFRSLYYIYNRKKGFHQSEKQIINTYYTREYPTKKQKETCIELKVDGRVKQGGYTQPVTSIYHYCKENGIKYYLNYIYPFELSQFLEPNKYNWKIEMNQITYNRNQAVPVIINDWQFDVRLHKFYLDKIVLKNKNRQIHIYSNTPYFKDSFRQDFNELFRPSQVLQNSINVIINIIGQPFIAMVFRFQQLLGDFKETGYKTLSLNEQKVLIKKCINKVKELHTNNHKDKLVLVTSDSITFLQTISKEFNFVRIIPGKVVHMDHTSDASNEVYMKSFVDLFVLSKAEKIYLLQTGDMYHSGFAKQASMIENVPYEEVLF